MRTTVSFVLLFLLLSVSVAALESEPSETVGYVKYECKTTGTTNFNLIAYSMDMGFTMASELGDYVGNVNVINYWDASSQGWSSATFVPGPNIWVGDFALADGEAYMLVVSTDVDAYIAGSLLTPPTFNLQTTTGTNFNVLSLPLDRSDLTTAGQMGDDIGVCDVVNKWDSTNQGWASATFVPGPNIWVGDFAIDIGDPFMVIVSSNTTWPSARAAEDTEIVVDQDK